MQGAALVATYFAFIVKADGQLGRFSDLDCMSDSEAFERAAFLLPGKQIEIWGSRRLVGGVDADGRTWLPSEERPLGRLLGMGR